MRRTDRMTFEITTVPDQDGEIIESEAPDRTIWCDIKEVRSNVDWQSDAESEEMREEVVVGIGRRDYDEIRPKEEDKFELQRTGHTYTIRGIDRVDETDYEIRGSRNLKGA